MSHEKIECPHCGEEGAEAEWCDVGIGFVQCGPYHCIACGATEIGPHDSPTPLTPEETETGWYRGPNCPSEHCSTLDGKFVDASTALALYRRGLVPQVPFKLTSADLLRNF